MLTLIRTTGEVPPGRFRFYQTETKTSIGPYSTLARLIAEVKQHRKSNNLPIGTALSEEIQDWLCRHMDGAEHHCHERDESGKAKPMKGSTYAGTGYDGREKWAQLHTYALVERPTPQMREVWVSEFTASLPCGECKQGFRAIMKADKLPLTATPQEFLAATVRWHNAVNDKLGYPQMGIDDALKIWSR